MRSAEFLPGINSLVSDHAAWLRGRRVGLLANAASVDRNGSPSVDLLRAVHGVRLVCLFAPEHGFFAAAGAGAPVRSGRHPLWDLPIRSLYGAHRRPEASMLRDVDTIVFDLQDLATRSYTYVSTLRLTLEAAAASGKTVIVADRPVPLPNAVDGPVTEPGRESFVAALRVPLSYGMTPGEAARWIVASLGLAVDLRVAPMHGYRREAFRGAGWPPWIPPSPGIRSWESAMCYPATVGLEALPALDHGRRSLLPFQVVGAPWLKTDALLQRMAATRLPGVRFHRHLYVRDPAIESTPIPGIRMTVVDPDRFRPVRTFVALLHHVGELHGLSQLWKAPGTRVDFFDTLLGTATVRHALLSHAAPASIWRAWEGTRRRFLAARSRCLLYRPS